MGNILFGYENLALEANITITSGDEAGDFVDDNVAKPNPALFWRADNLTLSTLAFSGLTSQNINSVVEMVALLYCTASPRKNLLASSNNFQSADWSTVNVTQTPVVGVFSPISGSRVIRHASSGTGNHYADQSYDLARSSAGLLSPSIQHEAIVYARREAGTANVELEIGWDNRGETASIEVDLGDGSTNTTNNSANVTIDSTSVTDKTNGWYEIRLRATATFSTKAAVWTAGYRAYVLNSGFVRSYTAAGESVDLTAPKLVFGTASTDYEPTTGNEQGGRWIYKAWGGQGGLPDPSLTSMNYDSGWLHTVHSDSMRLWANSHGWSHAWHLIPAASRAHYDDHQIELHCNNATQVDLSGVYLGPVFQPTRNLDFDFKIIPTTANPPSFAAPGGQEFRGATTGPRMWEISLKYQRESEALGDFHALGIKLQRDQPLLVILDPDETAYGQEKVIYGFLESLEIGPVTYDATLATLVYNVRIAVLEVLR